jgi:hypothetical protein
MNMKRNLYCFILICLGSFLAPQTGNSVMRQYLLTVSNGTAFDMSSGTTAIWTGTGNLRFFAASTPIAVGFTFPFDGRGYDQLVVYTSGAVSLGSTALNNYVINNLSAANVTVIAPFWDSIGVTGTQGGCAAPKVRYKVFGSAPNRTFVVEWFDEETVWMLGSRGTFQLRLYENGKIEYYYQTMNNCATCGNNSGQCGNTSASIGLADSVGNFLSITPAGTSANSSTTAANNAVNIDTASTPIAAGKLYTLIRPKSQLSVDLKTLAFPTISPNTYRDLCVKVKNVGTEGPLVFFNPSFSGVVPYTVVSSPPPLAAGDSGYYCIRFAPTGTGPFGSVFTINSGGIDSGTQTVSLSGTSVAPTIQIIPLGNNTVSEMFRNVRLRVGDTLEQKFLVRNNGVGYLVLSNTSFMSGNYGHYYAFSRLPLGEIPAGASDTVAVKFMPRKDGFCDGTLNLVSNSSTGTQAINLVGVGIIARIQFLPAPNVFFGELELGDSTCQSVSVSNAGTDTLKVSMQYFTTNDGDFRLDSLFGASRNIPPNSSRDIQVCFKPLARGDRIGGIRMLTNIPQTFEPLDGVDDGNYDGGPEQYIRRDTAYAELGMSGIGKAVGKMTSVALTAKPFIDSSLIGVELCRIVDLTNFGTQSILINDMQFVGAAKGDYTYSGITLPYTLDAQKSVNIQICATPSARGPRPVFFSVLAFGNDSTVSYSDSINVKGLQTCARRSKDTLFASTKLYPDSTENATLTITNCGDNVATYTGEVTGSEYTLASPATVTSVAPGGTANFTVQYKPTKSGLTSGDLKISTTGLPAQHVVLLGEGICAIPDAAEDVTAPGTPVRDTNEFEITISNTGTGDWKRGVAFISPDSLFTFIASKSDTVIAAGGTGKVTVSFHPRTIGNYLGVLTFPNGGPCEEKTVTITLHGTANVNGVREITEAEGFSLAQNRPNPAIGAATITYTTPHQANVRIILADITGKTVRELASGNVSGGSHDIVLSTSGLASGSYIYILESGNVRLVRQMVVNK